VRQIADLPLWVGHVGNLRDLQAILAVGIEAVVELADNEPPAMLPRDMVHCRFPISDAGETTAWLLRLAVNAVAALVKAGKPTMVCCSSGMNRSVAIAAAGVAIAKEMSLDAALNALTRSGAVDVSPRLLAALREAAFAHNFD
jgi:protein-tyrosine phosphatase